MRNYDVGYGKPPKNTRFKSGVSGNPKGRPKRKPSALAKIIHDVLSAPVEYRERGRLKAGTRQELTLRRLVGNAIKGDLVAAELVLRIRARGLRYGEPGVERLLIHDWLPDFPGQTADQKTREFKRGGEAEPLEWWQKSEGGSVGGVRHMDSAETSK